MRSRMIIFNPRAFFLIGDENLDITIVYRLYQIPPSQYKRTNTAYRLFPIIIYSCLMIILTYFK